VALIVELNSPVVSATQTRWGSDRESTHRAVVITYTFNNIGDVRGHVHNGIDGGPHHSSNGGGIDSGGVRDNNGSKGFLDTAFDSINKGLGERFVCQRVWEIIGTICRVVINIDATALEATFVVVKEMVFGFEKFWQYKVGISSTCGSSYSGGICVMRRFSQGICVSCSLASCPGQRLKLRLFVFDKVINAPDFYKPFLKLLHFT